MGNRTWFQPMELLDRSGWIVLRLDEASLPQATVVTTGHRTQEEAEAAADSLRTGQAPEVGHG